MRAWALCLFALAGCDVVWDGQAPVLRVLGVPPSLEGRPRLNVGRATSQASILYGADGAPWATFEEALPPGGPFVNGRRIVRLVEPATSELFPTNDVVTGRSALYVFDRGAPGQPSEATRLLVRAPGGEGAASFTLPPGPGRLTLGPRDAAFAYWPLTPGTTHYLVHRRDGAHGRRLPLPEGVPAETPADEVLALSPDEAVLLERGPSGRLRLHATSTDVTRELGERPGPAAFAPRSGVLVTCGPDGVRAHPLEGPEAILEPLPCDPSGGLAFDGQGHVYYARSAVDLVRVPVDGSAGPEWVAPGRRFLAADLRRLAYSRDPVDAFAHGAGDGWVGEQRFMQRGIGVTFLPSRWLVWLDHAAKSSPIGDLYSASVAGLSGGGARKLTLNVAQVGVLFDDRVLVADQQPFRGEWNRVIVLDDSTGVGRWVAERASGFAIVPTGDVLVDVVTGPDTWDIVPVRP